jgi:hypothetical protein
MDSPDFTPEPERRFPFKLTKLSHPVLDGRLRLDYHRTIPKDAMGATP